MTKAPSENKIEVGYKTKFVVTITDKMVKQFAEVSGDFNPIHMDDAYAAKTRFKRRIAHGMIAAALISRCLNENMGEGGIYLGQTLKFVNPIYIDDEVSVELEVRAVRKEKGIASIDTFVKRTKSDEVCVKGEAVIMIASSL